MAAFDFIRTVPPYAESARSVRRLERRYELLVAPYRAEFDGARVLDLGAHDGRWAYVLAEAGASEVVAIE